MRALRGSFYFFILFLAVANVIRAQQDGNASAPQEKEETLPDTPAVQAFQKAKSAIDQLNEEIEAIFAKARTLTREDIDEVRKLQAEYSAKLATLQQQFGELRTTALAALEDAPKSESIGEIVLQIAIGEIQGDKYAEAYKLLKVLMEKGNEVDGVHDAATMAAFGQNMFEAAQQHLQASIENKETQRLSGRFSAEDLAQHAADWKKEQEIRAAEAQQDDLPRVKLETTAGDIVIELFENEAPQAVANFVSLVEKKYYDGLIFHRVLPGFMAQGGCPDGRGTGGPGYNIYCECHQDNYRKHFAGTLSMAHAGRNTGGSQFFLTFLPTPHLDGRHTAFGRVIEGMDVLSELQRVNPQRPTGAEPSKIVKATVLRKRDHEYQPTKVE